jgi:hypothetical protein
MNKGAGRSWGFLTVIICFTRGGMRTIKIFRLSYKAVLLQKKQRASKAAESTTAVCPPKFEHGPPNEVTLMTTAMLHLRSSG